MNPEKSNGRRADLAAPSEGKPEIFLAESPGCSEAVQPQRSSGQTWQGLPAGAEQRWCGEQLPRGLLWSSTPGDLW